MCSSRNLVRAALRSQVDDNVVGDMSDLKFQEKTDPSPGQHRTVPLRYSLYRKASVHTISTALSDCMYAATLCPFHHGSFCELGKGREGNFSRQQKPVLQARRAALLHRPAALSYKLAQCHRQHFRFVRRNIRYLCASPRLQVKPCGLPCLCRYQCPLGKRHHICVNNDLDISCNCKW